ncbi:MAG: type IV toxin-antitoxin system AbiEi family antitoxin domain-containing protein [Phycisphaerae bacterium]
MVSKDQTARLLDYVRGHGLVRARDLKTLDIPRAVLKRLVDRGHLVRRSRGVYTVPDHELTRHTDLAEVCAWAPQATVCLISALDFHELTTQIPHAVWIMIARSGRRPKIDQPPIHIVYASGEALTAGVERRLVEGVNIAVTNAAKTVARLFQVSRSCRTGCGHRGSP